MLLARKIKEKRKFMKLSQTQEISNSKDYLIYVLYVVCLVLSKLIKVNCKYNYTNFAYNCNTIFSKIKRIVSNQHNFEIKLIFLIVKKLTSTKKNKFSSF